MKNNIKSLIGLHAVLLLYSVTGILSKAASKQEFLSLPFILLYGGVVGILFVYALLWQQVIRKIPLVTAYANKAVTVIWGIVWGTLIFKEKITIFNVIGALIIIVGVYVMLQEEENKE